MVRIPLEIEHERRNGDAVTYLINGNEIHICGNFNRRVRDF